LAELEQDMSLVEMELGPESLYLSLHPVPVSVYSLSGNSSEFPG